MKLSKIMHVLSVMSGVAAFITFASMGLGGTGEYVFGVTRIDALLCVAILFLLAIWLQLATMHHMMLEKRGDII